MFKLVLTLCFVALVVATPLSDDQTRSGRIVGGSNAAVNQFPYMASIRSNGVHMCGGALISARWVLSAAHCTRTLPVGTSSIVVGSITRASGGDSYGITRIVNHVAFDARTMDNDISLIESASTIVFSQSVRAINIGSGSIGTGVSTTIVGFGQTSDSGPLAENLQFMTAPSITNTLCRSRFSITNAARVRDEHLCTQSPAGQGLCFGDGGTPVMVGSNLVAVNSWGIPCATGSPDVHTRVGSFRVWISVVSGL